MAGEVTGSHTNHSNTAGSERRRDQSQPSANSRDTLRANENPLFILENAFVESNCSDFMDLASMNGSCGNFTVASNFTNSTTMAGDSYYFYETEQFAVMWILFISIVVGNVAVIVALMLSKTRKSRTNFFIMHLALADLSVGLISVLTDIVWKSTVSWHAGNVGCKAVRFAQVL
ncbi:cardioacceleratory peptide receptor-like, partial [Penaeus monodon]